MTLHANWDDLRLLLAVSRRGSFLQAGQLLGIAASTLSRRLTQLEVAVGEPLVERGVEGCRLTSRGQSLVEVAITAESGLRRQTLSGTSQQPTELSGSVLVSAGEGFSDYILEAIRRFTSLHPRCSVELTVAAEFHKIARGVADVAVRTAHLGEPSLIYRPIGRLAYGIFAAPGYLKQFPGVTLTTAVSVSLLPPLDILPQMRAAKAAGLDRAQISVNSFAVQLQSVKRGMGVAALPRIAATDLVELFPHLQLPDMEIYLVTRPQALKQAHIKCFFDTLEGVLLEAVSSANATVVPRATC